MEGGVSVSLLGAGAVLFGLWDPHPPPPLLSHSLGKADEVLVVGVDVGELNVDQQQDLGGVGGSVGGWELWDYGGGSGIVGGGNLGLGVQSFGTVGWDHEEGGFGVGNRSFGIGNRSFGITGGQVWEWGIWDWELWNCGWGAGGAVGPWVGDVGLWVGV